jgi:hypothetical protein
VSEQRPGLRGSFFIGVVGANDGTVRVGAYCPECGAMLEVGHVCDMGGAEVKGNAAGDT